ncbi:hypothetical protein AVEN_90654-1 [Araneus ventricosus]|uniref:Uncharacterized protein n=1 Tax=Araneus ventricosus TaxID=182803 RepID=A0A4Y2HJZ9_ARAVE|nr:hypothetical protein AVEN_90654-1 [Araneus ventricosus]
MTRSKTLYYNAMVKTLSINCDISDLWGRETISWSHVPIKGEGQVLRILRHGSRNPKEIPDVDPAPDGPADHPAARERGRSQLQAEEASEEDPAAEGPLPQEGHRHHPPAHPSRSAGDVAQKRQDGNGNAQDARNASAYAHAHDALPVSIE